MLASIQMESPQEPILLAGSLSKWDSLQTQNQKKKIVSPGTDAKPDAGPLKEMISWPLPIGEAHEKMPKRVQNPVFGNIYHAVWCSEVSHSGHLFPKSMQLDIREQTPEHASQRLRPWVCRLWAYVSEDDSGSGWCSTWRFASTSVIQLQKALTQSRWQAFCLSESEFTWSFPFLTALHLILPWKVEIFRKLWFCDRILEHKFSFDKEETSNVGGVG